MAKTKKVFLDMDPGTDDAIELLMLPALSDIELLGISTVAGNVDVAKTTKNALKLLDYMGLRARVFKGSSRPLIRPHVNSSHVHGKDGLGGVSLPEPRSSPDSIPGPVAMSDVSRNYSGELIVVATGPLTNIAVACLLDPDFPKRVRQLVIMGGAFGLNEFGQGNVTRHAEFNIYEDPEAASLVFGSFDDIICIGLDVTMNSSVLFREKDVERLRKKGSKRATLAAELMMNSLSRAGFFAPHDPLALFTVHEPKIISGVRGYVEVDTSNGETRGKTTLVKSRSITNALVASEVDGQRFKEELIQLLSTQDS